MVQNAARKIELADETKNAVRKILDLVKADIDEDDLLAFFEQDPNTTIIAQHCEYKWARGAGLL